MHDTTLISLYALIPVGAALLGGILASLIRTPHKLLAMLQFLVAGVLLAVISTEFTPKLIGLHKEKAVLIGGVLGLFIFVLINIVTKRIKTVSLRSYPIGSLFSGIVHLFLDGTLIGIAFLADIKSGLFVSEAIAVCIFLITYRMGESVSSNIGKTLSTLLLTLSLPIGIYLGYNGLKLLGTPYYYEILAFGTIGLLYLSFEDLVKEAQDEKPPFGPPLLFIGFILILILQG